MVKIALLSFFFLPNGENSHLVKNYTGRVKKVNKKILTNTDRSHSLHYASYSETLHGRPGPWPNSGGIS